MHQAMLSPPLQPAVIMHAIRRKRQSQAPPGCTCFPHEFAGVGGRREEREEQLGVLPGPSGGAGLPHWPV